MTTDYISNGTSAWDVLAMFYSVPLALAYREKPDLVFRADGRIHGHFAATQTVFVFTPDDYEIWQQAYAANVELFPLT